MYECGIIEQTNLDSARRRDFFKSAISSSINATLNLFALLSTCMYAELGVEIVVRRLLFPPACRHTHTYIHTHKNRKNIILLI